MKIQNKILILAAALFFTVVSQVAAVEKLEATGPAADVLSKVMKLKEKAEDVQSRILKLQEKYTKKAEEFFGRTMGTEGAALFKSYVTEPGAGVVKSALKGQFNAGNFNLKGITDAIKSQLGDLKLDYASLALQAKDMLETAEAAKREKERALDAQYVKLAAERDAMNKLNASQQSAELEAKIDEMDKRLADLEKQKTEIANENLQESAQQKELQQQMAELAKKISDIDGQVNQDSILKQLNAEALSLFGEETEEAENDALYNESIEKLFLGKYEFETSPNIARIRKARKREYYKAEKNLVKVIVETYNNVAQTQDYMLKCNQASADAQALFGSYAMRVCEDLQLAKIGVQFMQIQLASLSLAVSGDIQRMVSDYKLRDYDRDYTKFNLDDYVLTEKDFKKNSMWNKLKSKANSKVTNFLQ